MSQTAPTTCWIKDKLFFGLGAREYLRSLLTPFNAVAAMILLAGGVAAVVRFGQGLGTATNLSHDNPWGLWIGFDLLCGVALAAVAARAQS